MDSLLLSHNFMVVVVGGEGGAPAVVRLWVVVRAKALPGTTPSSFIGLHHTCPLHSFTCPLPSTPGCREGVAGTMGRVSTFSILSMEEWALGVEDHWRCWMPGWRKRKMEKVFGGGGDKGAGEDGGDRDKSEMMAGWVAL